MKILAVDDEATALRILTRAIQEAEPHAELRSFQTVSSVMEELREGRFLPDVAFLDIEMPGMTGLELARQLKQAAPRVNVVFVTGYSQYALEALSIRPSGYVMKPVDAEQIVTELQNLRNPPQRTIPPNRVRIRCFGDFDVIVDGQNVHFARAKSKELLAYLVDRRGASCTPAKIAEAIWEDGVYDRARQKLFSTVCADMLKALAQVDAGNIVKKAGSSLAVDPAAFDCDYYSALAGDIPSINSFVGEYMGDYAWAEFTLGTLAFTLHLPPEE